MTATLSRPQPKTARPTKGPACAYWIGQTLCYVILCLGLLEAVFYAASVGDSEYIKPDLTVGYTPMEGKEMTQRREGFGRFKINSFGMQNDEISLTKPPGVLRIAVLGDSYVESLQVERQANYCSLLARDLSQKLKRKVEVLNFGIAGYSIAQDYLRYQILAKKFAPDLVILSFRVEEVVKLLPYTTTNLMAVRPVFFPGEAGKLIYDNACVRNFLASNEGKRIQNTYWLRRYSRIWGVIGSLVQNMSAPAPAPDAKPVAAPTVGGGKVTDEQQLVRSKFTGCYWYLMAAQLNNLVQECRSNNTKAMIIRTPSGTTNDTETKLLKESAGKIGIPVLNVDEQYRQEFGPADRKKHFLGHSHFTKLMHHWVEGKLADFLIVQHPELLQALEPAAEGGANEHLSR